MKHFIIIIFLALGVMGCDYKSSDKASEQTVESDFNGSISIITVDSCQYVFVKKGYGGGLSHKGNCNNPIHNGGSGRFATPADDSLPSGSFGNLQINRDYNH